MTPPVTMGAGVGRSDPNVYELPQPPTVDPGELAQLLNSKFSVVGVASPGGRLFVALAWLYLEATRFMETLRIATQEMRDDESLSTVLARLQDNVESMAHYATAAKPDIEQAFDGG